MTKIYDIADGYVDQLAALDPNVATAWGVAGYDDKMTDYSPDGFAAIADLDRRTLRLLTEAPVEGDRDRIARDVVTERLGVRLDSYDSGEYYRSLRTIGSPLGGLRSVFDQMPRATESDWENIASRLRLLPESLANYRRTLEAGRAAGKMSSQRLARECAKQAETWSGLTAGTPSFFSGIVDSYDASGIASDAMRADIDRSAAGASDAYASMRTYLLDTYLPSAPERDAAGRERYEIASRASNGAVLDLDETYAWGWEELYRVERELASTAASIKPGASVIEARQLLETDPARTLESVDAFRGWLQEVHDRAIDELDGAHFEIDPKIKRVEVMIPPAGGALAPYYSGPSEDFARPGRTWWPIGTRTRFPMWREVSTAYHEGVPGHHLQVGAVKCLGQELSRYQRTAAFISGHGEGWALYAERLMGELGYLENPDYYLGMLSAQAMRCVRVIIDIGMHLEKQIPQTERFHPGETWNHDLALEFAVERSLWPAEFMASEVVRYLGWPSQAISYKVGERAWMAARDSAKQRLGAAFDLKRFHTTALNLGPMGLAQLDREIAAATSGA